MNPRITNIQRFCIHDGPGIRTVIFFKGCSLHCPWCANPESISYDVEYGFNSKMCKKTKDICLVNPSCNICKNKTINENDFKGCRMKAIVKYGLDLSVNDIISTVSKDSNYYLDGGGVTYSGGEALLQLYRYPDLFIKLNTMYHTAVETSLHVPKKSLEIVEPYIDLFIVDLKTCIEEDYVNIVGGNFDIFLDNLNYIKTKNRNKDVIFRVPVVPGLTDKPLNVKKMNDLIADFNPLKIQFFSIHGIAKTKYDFLNRFFIEYPTYSLIQIQEIVQKIHFPDIEILKL